MGLIDIDFEWWRDEAGYRLVAAEPPDMRPIMNPFFHRPAEPTAMGSSGKPQRVVSNGGRRIVYRPLLKFDRLCKAFASVSTPEHVFHFISSYGPLTDRGLRPDLGEDVPFALNHAAAVRGWLDASERPRRLTESIDKERAIIADFQAQLSVVSGKVALRIVPKDLLEGLWLQLAAMFAGAENTIRACDFCGGWFTAGRGTRRRLDAKFCSDKHRIRYNSLKRGEGR
jgi:hypothetical protein